MAKTVVNDFFMRESLLQRNSRGPQLYRRRRLAPQYAGLPA